MKINIAPALSAVEIGMLSAVAQDIWNEYFPSLISQDQIDYMLDKFLSQRALMDQLFEGYEFYFAVDDEGNVLGFFVIHPEEDRLFLSKIYLFDQARGKGYASDMFDFIEERAKELGLTKIYLTVNKNNHTPIKVYQHRGYETIDSVVTDIGEGFVMDDYIMEKVID